MLVLKNVTKSFGGIMATEDISMKLKPGSINAIIGPNGAGKTTLLKILSRIASPTKGTAKIVIDLVNGEQQDVVANLTVESFTPLGI